MKSKSLISLGLIAVLQLNAASVVEEHYTYDAVGRLTEVTDGNGVAVESYRYDGVGNIVEKVLDGETYRLSYDAAHQIKSVDGPAGLLEFRYDKAGRMITETLNGRTLAEYTWGYFDKVIEVKRNGKVTRFDYDARGMLVGKHLPDGTYERWVWDGMALIARGDEYYVNEPHITGGLPIVSKTKEGVLYHQYDPLGTTLASYTADGKLAATYKATVFGKGELQNSPAARFTGKPYDADLGAYVFPFRNYKPELARWMSADPSGFPDGPNSHSYAPVPTMGVDPLGLWRTGTPYSVFVPKVIPTTPMGGIPIVVESHHTDMTDKDFAALAPGTFGLFGARLSQRAVEHLIASTGDEADDIVLNASEQNMFISHSAFDDFEDAVHERMEAGNGDSVTFGSAFSKTIRFTGWRDDLRYAIHKVKVRAKGALTPTYVGNGMYNYSGDLTVSFKDDYDFAIGNNPLVNVFARLEKYGWTSSFDITGSWKVNFQGSFPEQ